MKRLWKNIWNSIGVLAVILSALKIPRNIPQTGNAEKTLIVVPDYHEKDKNIMKENRLKRIFALLFVFLGFILPACSHAMRLPDPETVSGVYIQSGFEYYRWEEGLELMIWHDGINHIGCSSFTNGKYEIECTGESIGKHSFAWHLETPDEKTAQFTIDDQPFDLGEGRLFIIKSSSGDTEIKQLKRDLTDVQADANSVIEFGLSDPEILAFIQTNSEISDRINECVSATIPDDDSKLPDAETAQQALTSFFSHLHDGEYEQATALYGGPYSGLQDLNPGINPDDRATLFKNACTENGAKCLDVRQATLLDQPSTAKFRFAVEFLNEDGSLYSRDPCCGDGDSNFVEQTEFIYTVRLECTGNYKVLELPVFGP